MENKAKLLVYIGSFFPYEDAITNVTLPLINKLKSEYEIDIYTRSKDGRAPLEEEVQGYHVFRDKQYNGDPGRVRKYREIRYRSLNLDITSHRLFLLKQAYVWLLRRYSDEAWKRHLNRGETEPWEQEFSDVLKKKDYTAVLTVSSHIQAQTDALQMAKQGYFKEHHIAWIAYFVDPFSTYSRNLLHPDSASFMKFETEVYQYADTVFVSPEMYEDNMKYPMGKYRYKTVPIQYASMKPLEISERDQRFDRKMINCVYVGSFFDITIRNPGYFFKIASRCNPSIQFHIVCSLSNPTVDSMKSMYLDGHENIHWYSGKPLAECQIMMKSADVLINIGNEAANQTPSKVFDYIGACKHIVNFYSLENDTSRHYLEKYPYHIDIRNRDSADSDDIHRFEEFAELSKTEAIDENMIWKEYAEFSSASLAEHFFQKFDQAVKEKDKGNE